MAVLIRNVSMQETAANLQIPVKPDGSWYRFELICDSGWSRVYDDTPEGLLTHLIPGYANLSDDQRLAARIRYAVDAQVRLQAQVNDFFRESPRTPSEEEVLFGGRTRQPILAQWDCEVPLVLIDAYYAPYGVAPQPVSGLADVAMPPNLWWLAPASGEMDFLTSLHRASLIDLHIARDEVA